jgi:hypothetical protein
MAVAAVLVAAGGVAVWVSAERGGASVPAATAPVTPAPAPSFRATADPTPSGFPANTASYPLDQLPQVDVYAVIPALPVDADPYGAFTGELARATAERIPVFADPTGEPVAALPRDHHFDGTTVPVIERQEHWVRVLLTGRSALPSAGDPGQLTGWVRAQDVELTGVTATIDVDLAARTIDIVTADGARERVADDYAWGTEATPTPRGRSFVMMVRTDAALTYTRGHPLVYLSVQSPTLDGFGGVPVAVTAFHYHDARSGAISNGCLRLAPEAIDRLAQLPVGTPVIIR